MRKKAYRKLIAYWQARADSAERERDDLRRQLQRIRIAHEPLHEAIFPGVLKARP